MTGRVKTAVMAVLITLGIITAFIGGCTLDLIKPPPEPVATPGELSSVDLDLIREAWEKILGKYVEPDKVDARKLTEGALKGMVDALDDPYSAYLNKELYKMSISDFEGKFEGIGAYVGLTDGKIMVIAPIPGTPAEKAGIKSGDIILEVDDKSTQGLSVTDVVLMIRGPKGTPVKLTVLHKDETQPVEIEIVRAEIKVPSLRFEMKEDYAYIVITNFTDNTDEELVPFLRTITKNGTKGIIIDLRRNPGGILSTVVNIASHFLKSGAVVHVVDREGNKTTSSVKNVSPKIDLPLVVLVDEYSASGSEVLAGALQDHKRALVVGNKTYGKGSVNTLIELSDGSGIYITIARWQTPNGNLIEGKGIVPDREVDFEEVDGVQWAIDYLKGMK